MRDLIVDSFAGGGGASTGIEIALGRSPDFAINHDDDALRLHATNHPATTHLCSNIYTVDPLDHMKRGDVALAWFSPDCKHFSKAKGAAPVKRNIRDLAWVVVKWAERVRPRIIILENVEEFRTWGPVDVTTNKPIAERAGETWKRWLAALRRQGYSVQWRELRACDYGAPTIRKRLFVIARCDGKQIVWPEQTHAPASDPRVLSGELKPWRTAAEIIDWTIPCPSIFLTKEEGRLIGVKRPLVDATLRRIAMGVKRYVLDASDPFTVQGFATYAQHGGRNRDLGEPLHTIAASTKDYNGLIVPTLVQTGYGERPGQSPRVPGLEKPVGTIVAGGGKHALVAAFLAQHNTGVIGRECIAPVSTVTSTGSHQNVVAAHMISMHGGSRRHTDAASPISTITASGQHAGLVAAFLTKYYGTAENQNLQDPLHTVTTKDRFSLVTVEIRGETYVLSDIGMRMLTRRELFRAQGFPDNYTIDADASGRPFTKSASIRMVGNSVCPPIAAALVRANASDLAKDRRAA